MAGVGIAPGVQEIAFLTNAPYGSRKAGLIDFSTNQAFIIGIGVQNGTYDFARLETDLLITPKINIKNLQYTAMAHGLPQGGLPQARIDGTNTKLDFGIGLWCDLSQKDLPIMPYVGTRISFVATKMDIADQFPEVMDDEVNNWGFSPSLQFGAGIQYRKLDPIEIDLSYRHLLIAPASFEYTHSDDSFRIFKDFKSCITVKVQYQFDGPEEKRRKDIERIKEDEGEIVHP